MTLAVLLAPGPSMSRDLAESVRGRAMVGAITSAWTLAPWADFLAATDIKWWGKNPDAKNFAGRKFSPNQIAGVERVRLTPDRSSLVVGMEVAKMMGATKIALLGVDHHGTHFFGPYTDGCKNTSLKRRGDHAIQYAIWSRRNPEIEIVNCTPGTALTVFPVRNIEDVLNEAGRRSIHPGLGQVVLSGADEAAREVSAQPVCGGHGVHDGPHAGH